MYIYNYVNSRYLYFFYMYMYSQYCCWLYDYYYKSVAEFGDYDETQHTNAFLEDCILFPPVSSITSVTNCVLKISYHFCCFFFVIFLEYRTNLLARNVNRKSLETSPKALVSTLLHNTCMYMPPYTHVHVLGISLLQSINM